VVSYLIRVLTLSGKGDRGRRHGGVIVPQSLWEMQTEEKSRESLQSFIMTYPAESVGMGRHGGAQRLQMYCRRLSGKIQYYT
jgi:hypothetical protein